MQAFCRLSQAFSLYNRPTLLIENITYLVVLTIACAIKFSPFDSDDYIKFHKVLLFPEGDRQIAKKVNKLHPLFAVVIPILSFNRRVKCMYVIDHTLEYNVMHRLSF